MNSRIQKLAEQAGFDVKRLLEPYPGGFPREDALALESFAHLIVRECAELMYGRDENGNCKDGDVILQHFGIER